MILCDKVNNTPSTDVGNHLGSVSDNMSLGALYLQARMGSTPVILNET